MKSHLYNSVGKIIGKVKKLSFTTGNLSKIFS
jgi:hypothetical protein